MKIKNNKKILYQIFIIFLILLQIIFDNIIKGQSNYNIYVWHLLGWKTLFQNETFHFWKQLCNNVCVDCKIEKCDIRMNIILYVYR